MIKISTLALCLFFTIGLQAQTVLFTDDFESGTSNWTLTGAWGLNSTNSYSPSNSLTESPVGNYPDQTTSSATMASTVSLATALSADLSFYAIYDLEANFDYTYVEVSANGGSTWSTLATFTGDNQLSTWTGYSYSLGGYVGSSNLKVRFRFVSDQAVNADGMYIDNVTITSYTTDNAPPLIQHTPPVLYESNASAQVLSADLIDVSGISSTKAYFTVDGGTLDSVAGINTTGDTYIYSLPAQAPGAWVNYYIKATDASASLNKDSTQWYSYIAGNYIKYENGQVDFVNSFGPIAQSNMLGVAVRVSIPGPRDLVTALIRNYTDPTRPNDSMVVHIWANNNGVPGADLITPITIYPEATLSYPNAITRIDLRPYAAQLSNLNGDIFVGFTVPVGEVWTQQTNPGSAGRSMLFNGSTWTSVTDDYHFRVITGPQQGAPVADFNYTTAFDPQIVFTDQSTNSPTSWLWDFDDNGATSSVQDPTYSFTSNRNYNVCLTATNAAGSSTVCKVVAVGGVPPVASFTWDGTNDPSIAFTDNSPDAASAWLWTFGDTQQSIQQNPIHTYTSNGTFQVCLTIQNANGVSSTPYCDSVTVATVGISELNSNKVRLYPVPATKHFVIEDESGINGVEVMDLTGKVVLAQKATGNKVMVQLTLPAGVYIVKVQQANGQSTLKRLIVQ